MSSSPASDWLVGIDIGGSFTDLVAVRRGDHRTMTAKVPTRSGQPIESLLAALAAVGMDWSEVSDLVHGTTMVTNAIVEGRFAKVALIATKGFTDTLAIGRQNRRHLYRLDLPPKVTPLVPAERCFEVDERLDHLGQIIREPDEEDIDAAIAQAMASGAEAVAVSLIHSYANPTHEDRIGERLRGRLPYVAISNRINPEAREYERTATTVLSASVMPLAAGYLDELSARKPSSSRLHFFQSTGDMASPESVRDLPLVLAMSGPAAGATAAAGVARSLGIDHAISFDMGGTTTDVCLITSGRPEMATDRSLNERPLRQPMVAVESIGAGGGSIARLDHGALCVGPDSAGADPGPASYGRGGTHATVTDANLVLGYLNRERVFGNELHLDEAAAHAAVGKLAARAGMSVEQTALGIVAVANQAMVRALRRITVERGIDGRQCVLIAFGGAGPMHAAAVAALFGISRIIVPAASSAFSALGCVSAEMGYSQQRSLRMPHDDWDQDRIDAVLSDLRTRLAAPLRAAGHADARLRVEQAAAVRFRGQSYSVEIDDADLTDVQSLGRRFMDRHRILYGFATDEPWELVGIRMRVWALDGTERGPLRLASERGHQPASVDRCVFDHRGRADTARYDRSSLAPGVVIHGPAVVEDAFSTVVVPPRAMLTADRDGHLFIEIGER